jgi:DNA-binding transcriptional MerR regulator
VNELERELRAVPDRNYFRIGEVAKITGVKPYVLRYWETEFKEMAPPKSRSNQRMYRRREVETILRVKHLLYRERFTIEGARKRLAEMQREARSEAAAAAPAEVPASVSALSRLRGQLEKARDRLAQV